MLRGILIASAALLLLTSLPSEAEACGGLFCNNNQPVNQSAERILFAHDGGAIRMHVRISYSGPPSDFGWILPVPAGVEVELSSEELFRQLDLQYGPRFILTTEFGEECDQLRAMSAASGEEGNELDDGAGGGVTVVSREALGPFDRVTLDAENVGALRAWLKENAFQIPEDIDEKLQPYIDAGRVFVAVKLLDGKGSGEIQPLRLKFTGDVPSVPIRPTAVAADPDMGVIVHVLGESRAIPANYKHVQINEAAIDWPGQGQNYADVVSQAADEAGGHAFATDYAGDHAQLSDLYLEIDAQTLERVRAAETVRAVAEAFAGTQDADILRVLDAELPFGDGMNAATYVGCIQCYSELLGEEVVDGGKVADRVENEINVARRAIIALLEAHPHLSRHNTTLSPDEMTKDPEFAFNPDLADVPNQRTAVQFIPCGDNGPDFDKAIIETPSGLSFRLEQGANPGVILRQQGTTVAGDGAPGAAVIEQMLTSGAPEIEEDRRPELESRYAASRSGEDSGCSCGVAGAGSSLLSPGLLGLLLLGRRRRHR